MDAGSVWTDHRRGDHKRPWDQSWLQPPGDAEAHQADTPLRNKAPRRLPRSFRIAANTANQRPFWLERHGADAVRLAGKTGNDAKSTHSYTVHGGFGIRLAEVPVTGKGP